MPDSVTEEIQQAAYNVVPKISYRAAIQPVPATCLSQYAALVRPFYQALDWTFSARCFSISVDMNVTFVELQTEMHLVEDNIAEITYGLSVSSASRNSTTICADRRWTSSLTCPSRPPAPSCRLCWTWPPLPTIPVDEVRQLFAEPRICLWTRRCPQHAGRRKRPALPPLPGQNVGRQWSQELRPLPAHE